MARKSTSNSVKNAPKKLKVPTKKVILDEDDFEDDDLEDMIDVDEDLDNEESDDLPQVDPDEEDIFDFVDKHYVAKGKPVYFLIYESGTLLGQKMAPCSWLDIQKEFGGGIFKVQAKDVATKQYVKTETKTIAGARKSHWESPQNDPQNSSAQNASLSTQELLALMEAKTKEVEEKVRNEYREKTNSDSSTMAVLAQMMQQSNQMMAQSNQQFQTLLMEMNKNSMTMFKELSQNSQQMYERIQNEIRTANEKSEKPLGVLEMITLLDKTKQSGMDQMKMLLEMADTKADEKADLLAKIESMATGKEPKEPSFIDSIVKSLAPLLAANIQQAQLQTQAQAQGGVALPTPSVNQSAVHQPQVTRPMAIMPNPRTVVRQNPPVAKQPQVVKEASVVKPAQVTKPDIDVVNNLKKPKEKVVNKEGEAIKGVLLEPIKSWLLSRLPANEAADRARKLLAEKAIPSENVKKQFSLNDLIAIRKESNVPLFLAPQVDQWLKEFYGYLTSEKTTKPSLDAPSGASSQTA